MTISRAIKLDNNLRTSEGANETTLNIFDLDLSKTAERPTGIAITDQICIGLVPANEKLVPYQCLVSLPNLDSNGSPTGTYLIGTAADTDALKGSSPAQTAQILSGEDFITATAEVGDRYAVTPIYLTLGAAIATLAPTGRIRFYCVSRPWDQALDGQG